jgi:hypothetical protein
MSKFLRVKILKHLLKQCERVLKQLKLLNPKAPGEKAERFLSWDWAL